MQQRWSVSGLVVRGLCCFLLIVVCSACMGIKVKSPVNEFRSQVVIEAALNKPLSVAAGERMFVRGSLYEIDAYSVETDFESTMPNTDFAVPGGPFRFAIKKCDLVLQYQTKDYLYFCAPKTHVDSSHPSTFGLERVEYDAGLRKSKVDGTLQWFVDNSARWTSQYFAGSWVWARNIEPQDAVVSPHRVRLIDPKGDWVALYYAGYFDNKIHFELEESSGGDIGRRAFQFNVGQPGESIKAAIKGFVFEVDRVDNLSMTYRWIAVASK